MKIVAMVCEIIMVICFGASWPFNIVKAYKARTTKGTSLLFMSLIGVGYVGGILNKIFTFIADNGLHWIQWMAFAFYIINLCMIITGVIIYFRNKRLDAAAEQNQSAEN